VLTMSDVLGWTATAITASSYFFQDSRVLRWVQAVAAVIWMSYGILLHATPVIVANVIVAVVATGSSLIRMRGTQERMQQDFARTNPIVDARADDKIGA
jgi:hypothetical protein